MGFNVTGVTQVFKRFFHSYCELQIFFSYERGRAAKLQFENAKKQNSSVAFVNEHGHDWEYLLSIVNHCLLNPYHSVAQLKDSLKRTAENEFDMLFLPIKIHKIDHLLYEIHEDMQVSASSGNTPQNSSLIYFVGDASFTAHYRLGIGVNFAFNNLNPFANFLKEFNANSSFSRFVAETRSSLSKVVNYELQSIVYETYCDFLVFADYSEKDVLQSLLVFGKDYKKGDYLDEPYRLVDLLKHCPFLRNLNKNIPQ